MDFSKVKSITIPEGNVKSIFVGGIKIWSAEPKQLTAPIITLAEDVLQITDTSSKAESFDILVDGVVTANVLSNANKTTYTTTENESGGITYDIISQDYTVAEGIYTIGVQNAGE